MFALTRLYFDFVLYRTKNIWLKSFCVVHQRFPREPKRYVHVLRYSTEHMMTDCRDRPKCLCPAERCIYSQHRLCTLDFLQNPHRFTHKPLCSRLCQNKGCRTVERHDVWLPVSATPGAALRMWHIEKHKIGKD